MSSTTKATPVLVKEQHFEIASGRARIPLIFVDSDCRVVLNSVESSDADRRLLSIDGRRLRPGVEVAVKSLFDRHMRDHGRHSHIASLDAHRFVRVTRLDGPEGPLFAVSVEAFRSADSLSRAMEKYQLTPREIDVLVMILEGASAAEIADTLSIAETTVQGYYKTLLRKTGARNRTVMVTNVLDWRGSRQVVASH